MKKSIVLGLGVALSAVLSGVPVMAEEAGAEFHAMSGLSPGLTAMSEAQLAAIEGGTFEPICVGAAPFQPSGAPLGIVNVIAIPVNVTVACNNIAVVAAVGILGPGGGDISVGQTLQSTLFCTLTGNINAPC